MQNDLAINARSTDPLICWTDFIQSGRNLGDLHSSQSRRYTIQFNYVKYMGINAPVSVFPNC